MTSRGEHYLKADRALAFLNDYEATDLQLVALVALTHAVLATAGRDVVDAAATLRADEAQS